MATTLDLFAPWRGRPAQSNLLSARESLMSSQRSHGGGCGGEQRAAQVLALRRARMIDADEHTALLEELDQFDALHRKDDYLAAGVGTIFGVSRGVARLQSFSFHPGLFTPARARRWLR